MNAPNTKWSIVSNAPKPAINALKNAGKWQRNNNGHPAGNGTIHRDDDDKTNSKPMRTIPFSIEPFSHAAMKGAR